MNNSPLYCTLFNAQIGNLSGFKVNVVEADCYLCDPARNQTVISQKVASKLNATLKELNEREMVVEIVLNPDPIGFEQKIDRGERPSIPKWATIKVAILPETRMRIFDLIIGKDAVFKAKATEEVWNRHIENYKRNKKMSHDIS